MSDYGRTTPSKHTENATFTEISLCTDFAKLSVQSIMGAGDRHYG
jgi:hypothetical protein